MRKLPIPFQGPMVRAILDGSKTQTRRILKVQPPEPLRLSVINDGTAIFRTNAFAIRQDVKLQYAVGDLLYVREAWRTLCTWDTTAPSKMKLGPAITDWPIHYIADGENLNPLHQQARYRQGMHMMRSMTRITLEVTGVKVERLQDISEEDANAEGVDVSNQSTETIYCSHIRAFKDLWNSINAERKEGIYAWSKNPWVAAYTFKPIFKNVDQLANPPLTKDWIEK